MWLFAFSAFALGATPSQALAAGREAARAGDPSAAVAAYTECLLLAPDHVDCHWELGWALWNQGAWEGVVEHWQRVNALDPAHEGLDRYLPTAVGHWEAAKWAYRTLGEAPERPALPTETRLRLRAGGDVMMGTDFPEGYLPPNDGRDLLTGVAPLLQDADWTFVNLEGPLCDSGSTDKCKPGQNCYAFRTPTRYADYLVAAGVDAVSTANNHAEDFGLACRRETEAALGARGIAYSGRPATLATSEVRGVRIGLIGFHAAHTGHYLNDHATAALLVAAMARTHDLVVVSFHGGAEGSKATHVPAGSESFYGENRGHLREFARVVVGAGADLVLGHGPHVPRGMELIDGHLVAYSLGNFATYGRFSLGGALSTTLVLEATLDGAGRLVEGRILPVYLEGKGVPVPDAEARAITLISELTTSDFPDSGPMIGMDGRITPRE